MESQSLVGKQVKIFLKNNFCFEGVLKNKDDRFIELIDSRKGHLRLIALDSIENIEICGGDKDDK